MGVYETLKIQKMKICLAISQAETHHCMTQNVRGQIMTCIIAAGEQDPTGAHGVYDWTFQLD